MKKGHWDGVISWGPIQFDLWRVGAVFWRWAWSLKGHPEDHEQTGPCVGGARGRFGPPGVLKSVTTFWLNHSDIASAAVLEPVQVCVAVESGLVV